MQYDRQRLIELVRRDALQFGDFVLSSGQRSTYYLDCRQVALSAEGAAQIAAGILEKLADTPFDAIGGLTLGADPVVGAVVAFAGVQGKPLRGFIVRKEAKQHATGKRIEGPLRPHDRVIVVEDTTTTGGSAQQAIDAAKQAGASVVGVFTVLDRQAGAAETFSRQGIPFHALLTIRDLGIEDPAK